jgi:uncharacterized protein (TIGR02145 family)
MKTRLIYKYRLLIAAFIVVFGIVACEKEDRESPELYSEIEFSISVPNPESISNQKCTIDDNNLDDADKVIITIQSSDGSSTKYTLAELKIQKMNEYFFTQKIALKTGNYILTEFLVLNASDSTIFASPHAGSQEAQNVVYPLPLSFSIVKNTTTSINVEVLSTRGKKPEDFGLNRFNILEVKTFSFMIGVTDSDNDQFINAELTVNNGSYYYIQPLENIANNVVNIKDNLSTYTLTIEKSGYNTFNYDFSLDSLKCYSNVSGNLPLVIELHKKLVTDIDGNLYSVIQIGNQTWMGENLRVTHLNDGSPILNEVDLIDWSNLTTAGYCWYNNNEQYKEPYGALYNWYAVNTNKLCPDGWHVPSVQEWETLISFLGENAGAKIKVPGLEYWGHTSETVTNITGFSAVGTGRRDKKDSYELINYNCEYWTSDIHQLNLTSYTYYLDQYSNEIRQFWSSNVMGLPVRCIKD